MDLQITKMANIEYNKSMEFMRNVDSKLMMSIRENSIAETQEWIAMLEFTIPYIEKALTKQVKQITVEEEIIKREKIKKVTVESIKHLTKKVNYVDKYNNDTGEVIPKKILNPFKEETFLTYENRFLYTLIGLIDDFIYLKEKETLTDFKGKDQRKMRYEAEVKTKSEKIKINVDYDAQTDGNTGDTKKLTERIKTIKQLVKMLKSTDLYKRLITLEVTPVSAPLKMTNVLLKNVNFQYCVQLWDFLIENIEKKNKVQRINKEYEEKGLTKTLIDEDMYLLHLISKQYQEKHKRVDGKKTQYDPKLQQELIDALIEKIIDINPEMNDKEINDLVLKKFIMLKTKKVVSLKPVEDRFKDTIEKYMGRVKEVRVK